MWRSGHRDIRLIRQLLTESVLLALVGGVCRSGAGLAWSGSAPVIGAGRHPRLSEVAIDARVLFFTLIVSVVAGIVFGLIPALKATETELSTTIKDAGAKGTTSRIHKPSLPQSQWSSPKFPSPWY